LKFLNSRPKTRLYIAPTAATVWYNTPTTATLKFSRYYVSTLYREDSLRSLAANKYS
jgi:hypothetical protein